MPILDDGETESNEGKNAGESVSKFGNPGFATRPTRSQGLDAIIAVGYRVNSYEATQFRIWATRVLREKPISEGQAAWMRRTVDCSLVVPPSGGLAPESASGAA